MLVIDTIPAVLVDLRRKDPKPNISEQTGITIV